MNARTILAAIAADPNVDPALRRALCRARERQHSLSLTEPATVSDNDRREPDDCPDDLGPPVRCDYAADLMAANWEAQRTRGPR